MRKIVSTGLVPLILAVPFRGVGAGETAGFEPAEAISLVSRGFATEAEIPEGVEAEDVDDLTPEQLLAARAGRPDKAADERARMMSVEIPSGWGDLPVLERIKLATQLHGAEVPSIELADRAIHDELVRRGQAATVFERGQPLEADVETVNGVMFETGPLGTIGQASPDTAEAVKTGNTTVGASGPGRPLQNAAADVTASAERRRRQTSNEQPRNEQKDIQELDRKAREGK